MTLPTSNLSVKAICQTLTISTPRAIFYSAGNRRTLEDLGTIVNADGLGAACPGGSPQEKLLNLYNDRKLSYFKGYKHNTAFLYADPESVYFEASAGSQNVAIYINGDYTWTATKQDTWVVVTKLDSATLKIEVETNGTPIRRESAVRVKGTNGMMTDIPVYQNP